MIIEQPAGSLQEQAALERQVARFYRWMICLNSLSAVICCVRSCCVVPWT